MSDLEENVARAQSSLYFSGARIDEHLQSFLDDHRETCLELGTALRDQIQHFAIVGSGGSFASALTAKYILDTGCNMPVDAIPSYELVWRQPRWLNEQSLVLLASYSGETEDSVAALRYARGRGAKTLALVGRGESTMANEADTTIVYDNGAIFELPIIAAILIASGLAGGQSAELAAVVDGIDTLPEISRRTLDIEAKHAESRARDLLHDQHLYVLGSGPLSPLAYKLAMSVVMENLRIGATYSDACEWRHGPAEALERMRGTFVVLLGTDASRELTMRTSRFCEGHGSRVMTYDAAEFGDVHPLLTPIIMNSHTQWLIIYSAILRGITDLDERVFMGRQVLATGGAQWP